MREIKFRAWDNINKRMGYFQPGFEWNDEYDLWYISPVDWNKRLSDVPYGDNINIMQFTGLKDKNGKEIYEGDIVILAAGQRCIIEYQESRFIAVAIRPPNNFPRDYVYFNSTKEVIGNIYENPELLK